MNVSQVYISASFAYFKKLENHATFIAVSLAATAIFVAIYRQLHRPDVIPFNRWTVSLGLTENKLDDSEIKNLEEISNILSPLELTRRIFAYTQSCSEWKPSQCRSYEDNIYWISSASWNELSQAASRILPSYRNAPQTLEDEKASFIQTWAIGLQPFFALINDNAPSWKEWLSPIQDSPRLAYTILFNCFAPFAASMVWEGIYDYLPSSIQEIGSKYVEHKGTIALLCFGLLALLYYKMRQEKGILVNLTDNFAHFHKTHQALDFIPSYQAGIQTLLKKVQTTNPGDQGSNILWYYPRNTHRTFVGKIGNVLAEMAATGRILPLKVFEFNVKLFLTEYRSKDAVYHGWHGILKHLNNPNTLVVFTEMDALVLYLTAARIRSGPNDDTNEGPRGVFSEDAEGKILFDLISLSIKNGKIRCLMELDEEDRASMARNPIMNCFESIRAPDITPQELHEFCLHSFARSDISCALTKQQIDDLFARITPVLSTTPIPPEDITDNLQQELHSHMRSWKENADPSEISKIRLAERHLDAAQTMKDQVLNKLWRERRDRGTEPTDLLKALLILEYVVIPLYRKNVDDLKKTHLMPVHLIDSAQKWFLRLFGAASPEEETRLKNLPEQLKAEIKGQDAAIDAMCKEILEWRKIPPLDGKPLVLFFAGTPGVGKSETATHLAYHLNMAYGIADCAFKTYESNVKRISLNRQQQGGIFGWDQLKAQILLHLLRNPASVIILEEWDKMNAQDKSSLLELLDATQLYMQPPWTLSSTNGPSVDKSCAIFILTSNISTEDRNAESTLLAQRVENVKQNIAASFDNETAATAFLSRIDAISPFEKISAPAAQDLIKKYLDAYVTQKVLPKERRSQVEAALKNIQVTDARELPRIVRGAICKVLAPSPIMK